jgi:hypothetical protein
MVQVGSEQFIGPPGAALMRQLVVASIVAAVAAGLAACGTSTDSKPSEPTATVSTAPVTEVTVDAFVGDWSPEASDGAPLDLGGPDNTADTITADGACRFVEFRVDREPDVRSAKVVFAARCANARLRGQGLGQMSNGVLFWKAQGMIALPSGRTCQFKFVEGNRAVRGDVGILRVHYNGTVCDVPVSGTQIVKRK